MTEEGPSTHRRGHRRAVWCPRFTRSGLGSALRSRLCRGSQVWPRAVRTARTHSERSRDTLRLRVHAQRRLWQRHGAGGGGLRPAVGRSAGEAGVGCAVAWGPERRAGGDASRAPAPAGSCLCHLEVATGRPSRWARREATREMCMWAQPLCVRLCAKPEAELQPGVEQPGGRVLLSTVTVPAPRPTHVTHCDSPQ